jgi:hypothetical protein
LGLGRAVGRWSRLDSGAAAEAVGHDLHDVDGKKGHFVDQECEAVLVEREKFTEIRCRAPINNRAR